MDVINGMYLGRVLFGGKQDDDSCEAEVRDGEWLEHLKSFFGAVTVRHSAVCIVKSE